MPKRIHWPALFWTAALILFFAGPIVAQLPPAATLDSDTVVVLQRQGLCGGPSGSG